jgi:hypothetical protein
MEEDIWPNKNGNNIGGRTGKSSWRPNRKGSVGFFASPGKVGSPQ